MSEDTSDPQLPLPGNGNGDGERPKPYKRTHGRAGRVARPHARNLAILNLTTSHDEATGIEELTFTVRVTAAPPLAAMERVAIQVLASHRPGAANDGVFESS